MKKLSIILLLFIIHLSCSNLERLDTTRIKDEMEGYKIKRVSSTQITYQVETLGTEISQALTKDFEKQMKGVSKARGEEICQLKDMSLIDSLSDKYNLKIRLLGQPDIGSNNDLYVKEKEILERSEERRVGKECSS